MARREWLLFSRDEDYRLTGGLLLSSFAAVIRHIGIDTAVAETPYSEDAWARTAPGCGIVAYRDGLHQFSGLIEQRTFTWDPQTGRADIKLQLLGDVAHLDERLVYPDHTRAGHDQTTYDHWTYTGPCSSAMWELVNEHPGPEARPERRVPALTMGADPGVGTVRPWRAQFESVLAVCARFSALSTPSPGIRLVTTDTGLRADVYAPRDRADDIKFSADLRNLAGFSYTEKAPTVTYAIAAGQGDLRNRARRAATSSDPLDLRWGRRIERYIDRRDEDDLAELQQAADDAITEGAGQVDLACTLTDSDAATYGTDWQLGDRVTVYVGLPGAPKAAVVTDVIREIALEVDNDGRETIRPAIGGFDAKAVTPTPTQRTLADIKRALEGYAARK